MKRIIMLGILAIAVAQLGCESAAETQGGGTPDGGTPDGGTPDGGTPDGGTPDGGTPDGGTPDGGITECSYTSSTTGIGWIGNPSCSATSAVIGQPLSCTAFYTGVDEAGANLVNPENFGSGGGGFVAVTEDGSVTIDIDTQFADPGEYIVVFDGIAEEGNNFLVTVFGFDEMQTDYLVVDQMDGMQGDTQLLEGCSLIRITLTE